MPELWRLFVGLPCPAPLTRRLSDLREELASADWELQFPEPGGFHVTLHFLGATDPKLVDDLRKDLGAMCHARRPFDLRCGGLGCFPDEQDPRILWAGIQDAQGRLQDLHGASKKVLDRYRMFKLEESYKPHLTLARVRQLNPAWNGKRLLALAPQWKALGPFPVENITLYRSREGGAYESLAEIKMGGS